jgi:gliding motility-associated-like protein
VITPNSDGINDSFVIRTDERLNIKSWHLIIYDRWGRLVYQTKDYKNDWRASDLNNGIYFYILRSSTAGLVYKGSISVLK